MIVFAIYQNSVLCGRHYAADEVEEKVILKSYRRKYGDDVQQVGRRVYPYCYIRIREEWHRAIPGPESFKTFCGYHNCPSPEDLALERPASGVCRDCERE